MSGASVAVIEREHRGMLLTTVVITDQEDPKIPHFCSTVVGHGEGQKMTAMRQVLGLLNQHRINRSFLCYAPSIIGCPHCGAKTIAQEVLFGKYVTKFLCGTRSIANFLSEPLRPFKMTQEKFPEIYDQTPLKHLMFSPSPGVTTTRTHNCLILDLRATKEKLASCIEKEYLALDAIDEIRNAMLKRGL